MWIPWDSCSTVTVRVLAVGDVDEHGEPARPSGVAHAGAAVAGRARDNRRVVRRESSRVLRQHPDRGEACRGGIRPRTGTQPRTRSRTRLGRARRLGYTRRESPRRYWCTRGEGTGRRSADGLDRRIRPGRNNATVLCGHLVRPSVARRRLPEPGRRAQQHRHNAGKAPRRRPGHPIRRPPGSANHQRRAERATSPIPGHKDRARHRC